MGVEIITVAVPKKLALKRQITRRVEVQEAMRRVETEYGERKRNRVVLELLLPKPGGHVLSP